MGRPASQDTITSLKKQLKDAVASISGMAKVIESLKNNNSEHIMPVVQIGDDKDILVVSLYDGILNVSTDGYGQGENYQFTYFGEEQTIPLSDLKRLFVKKKNVLVKGCYILMIPK